MMSDVLPYTMYDSMDYASVVDTPAPQGFAKRDAPMVQSRTEQPAANRDLPPMHSQPPLHALPAQGATGGGGGTAVEQKPQEDIQLGFEDVAPKGADIGNYHNYFDLIYIIVAVLAVDVIVIAMTRFFPELLGSNLNRWYDLFGLNAVIADVLIIVIGFLITRYVYTGYIKPKYGDGKWSPLMFTGSLVGVQLIHDLAFHFGVVTQVPRGANLMMDIFKDYAAAAGAKILFGDALMMIASSAFAIMLKGQPGHIVAAIASVFGYVLPYLLYQKNQFSVLR